MVRSCFVIINLFVYILCMHNLPSDNSDYVSELHRALFHRHPVCRIIRKKLHYIKYYSLRIPTLNVHNVQGLGSKARKRASISKIECVFSM